MFSKWARRFRAFPAALSLCLALPAQASDDTSTGDLVVSVGGGWPQGSTAVFHDPGFTLALRAAYHLPFLKGTIPTLGWNATFFPEESGLVDDETNNFIVLARQESDRFVTALNLGIQIGSPTRRGFFRPRAGVAPGVYVLYKDVKRTLPGDDDPYYLNTVWLGRAGWKGVIGADFFISNQAGVALEFVYDQIWHQDNRQSGRYQGFAVGLTLALDQLDDSETGPAGEVGGGDE